MQVNSGFFFRGSELTRGTLLPCWPETLSSVKLDGDNGVCEASSLRLKSL